MKDIEGMVFHWPNMNLSWLIPFSVLSEVYLKEVRSQYNWRYHTWV